MSENENTLDSSDDDEDLFNDKKEVEEEEEEEAEEEEEEEQEQKSYQELAQEMLDQIDWFTKQFKFYPQPKYFHDARKRLVLFLDPNKRTSETLFTKDRSDYYSVKKHWKGHLECAARMKKALEEGARIINDPNLDTDINSNDKKVAKFHEAYNTLRKIATDASDTNSRLPTLKKWTDQVLSYVDQIENLAKRANKRKRKSVEPEMPPQQKQKKEEKPVETRIVYSDLQTPPPPPPSGNFLEQIGMVKESIDHLADVVERGFASLVPEKQTMFKLVLYTCEPDSREITCQQLFETKEQARQHMNIAYPGMKGLKTFQINPIKI